MVYYTRKRRAPNDLILGHPQFGYLGDRVSRGAVNLFFPLVVSI